MIQIASSGTPLYQSGRRRRGITITSTSSAFTPASVAGLKTWLKADSLGLSDGAAVSTWADSSGNGNNAAQASGPLQPTFKTNIQNGLPVVRADGTDTLTIAGVLNNTAARTVFVVAKMTATGAASPLWSWDPNASFQASNSGFWVWSQNQGAGNVNLVATDALFHVFTCRFNSVSSCDFFRDAGAAVNFDPDNLYQSGTLALGLFSPASIQADLGELIVYDTAVSEADRASVTSYLKARWNTP